MFVDTHCHLNMMVEKKPNELLCEHHFPLIQTVVDQAQQAEVSHIITIGTSVQEGQNSIQIAKRFKNVFATVGIHPCDGNDEWRDDIKKIKAFVMQKGQNKIVGVGEIGLDFYHKPYSRQRQEDIFKAQIELALEYDMAMSVHVRDAADEVLKVLECYKKNSPKVVIHCFSQKQDFADIVVGWGFYIGIDGHITYPKNDDLRLVIKSVALERLLLESDAPFLPPQQMRGKQNSPAYIPLFAQTIADLKGISLEQLATATTMNARKFFGF
ncbi:MAG: TatD family hydrolase [bacterium]